MPSSPWLVVSRRPKTGFRVFTDPAGHPFCIVFGRPGTN